MVFIGTKRVIQKRKVMRNRGKFVKYRILGKSRFRVYIITERLIVGNINF